MRQRRALRSGISRERKRPYAVLSLESPAGPVEARVDDDGLVAVSMGVPEFEPAAIPLCRRARRLLCNWPLATSSFRVCACRWATRTVYCTSMMSIPRPSLNLGPESNDMSVSRNAQRRLCPIRDRGNMDLRVFERGVGETAPAAPAPARPSSRDRCLGCSTSRSTCDCLAANSW